MTHRCAPSRRASTPASSPLPEATPRAPLTHPTAPSSHSVAADAHSAHCGSCCPCAPFAPAPPPRCLRVVCSATMVSPGGGGRELEGEVRDECASSFGAVRPCSRSSATPSWPAARRRPVRISCASWTRSPRPRRAGLRRPLIRGPPGRAQLFDRSGTTRWTWDLAGEAEHEQPGPSVTLNK